MKDLILVAIVLIIVAAAALYIYRAKKQGKKCIGCPDGCSCGKDSNHTCHGSCGSGHH